MQIYAHLNEVGDVVVFIPAPPAYYDQSGRLSCLCFDREILKSSLESEENVSWFLHSSAERKL